MTAAELQEWLRAHFPKEDAQTEWKEWASLKHYLAGCKGADLGVYVSALANMDGGSIVIGVQDGTLAITGIKELRGPHHGERGASDSGESPHIAFRRLARRGDASKRHRRGDLARECAADAARQPVYAHDKAWQRDGDGLVELRPDRMQGILGEPLAGCDWSASVVPGAGLADMDTRALIVARQNFAKRHFGKPWAADIPGWSDAVFLDRARLSIDGGVTRDPDGSFET